MARLIVFRGKSACGKTLLTSNVSHTLGIPVFRKDDIFDPLSRYLFDNSANTAVCYDILANLARVSLNNGVDCILDVALPNRTDAEPVENLLQTVIYTLNNVSSIEFSGKTFLKKSFPQTPFKKL